MRLLLSIFLLSALLFKVMEPILVSLHFSEAMEAPVENISDEVGQIELKLYIPLPYGSNWEDENPSQETYQDSTGIYNIVATRYQNDTLYMTLQPNLNAHAQFDALSSSINNLSVKTDAAEAPPTKAPLTLSDLLKVFPPPMPPAIVRFQNNNSTAKRINVWSYTTLLSTQSFPVFAPPPENIA